MNGGQNGDRYLLSERVLGALKIPFGRIVSLRLYPTD